MGTFGNDPHPVFLRRCTHCSRSDWGAMRTRSYLSGACDTTCPSHWRRHTSSFAVTIHDSAWLTVRGIDVAAHRHIACLETKEPIHFDDERAIPQRRESGGGRSVVLVGVDEEDLAAGLIFPPVPQVGSKRAINGTELQ